MAVIRCRSQLVLNSIVTLTWHLLIGAHQIWPWTSNLNNWPQSLSCHLKIWGGDTLGTVAVGAIGGRVNPSRRPSPPPVSPSRPRGEHTLWSRPARMVATGVARPQPPPVAKNEEKRGALFRPRYELLLCYGTVRALQITRGIMRRAREDARAAQWLRGMSQSVGMGWRDAL